MFDTVFEKVTSYLSRRFFVSVFFPNLVFWALTITVIVMSQIGWDTTFKIWNGLGITAQVLIVIAFLSWVTFCSFLTINFRTPLIRLYEGYWPTTGFAGRIYNRRRKDWQERWDKLASRDRKLKEQQEMLFSEREAYEELLNSNETIEAFQKLPQSAEAGQLGKEFDAFLEELKKYVEYFKATFPPLRELEQRNEDTTRDLEQRGEVIRERWRQFNSHLTEKPQTQDTTWEQRYYILTEFIRELNVHLGLLYNEIEEQRLPLANELFLYYPPERVDIMPTRLGNVLKSAERSVWHRYRLDAVLAWPRLQSAIPSEFAEPLRDAKTSLDLVTTLSAFILLFGLPLSLWATLKLSLLLPWWLPFLVGILALALRHFLVIGIASLALILTFIASFIPITSSRVAHFQVFLVLLGGILLLSWLSYQNAVQAGLSYGEKIKAAFDLYRWKLLEALHLQLPTDFDEERKIWEEVCGLLVRNYAPKLDYYRYVRQEQTGQPISIIELDMTVPVPVRDIPAYHIIASKDIQEIDMAAKQVPINAAQKKEDLIGQFTLKGLAVGQPVCLQNVIDPKTLEHTAALGIQATLSTALGDSLQIGDRVDIIITPPTRRIKSPPNYI
jgi:ABC-type multidrug transport system fused ATPase/permease subunit